MKLQSCLFPTLRIKYNTDALRLHISNLNDSKILTKHERILKRRSDLTLCKLLSENEMCDKRQRRRCQRTNCLPGYEGDTKNAGWKNISVATQKMPQSRSSAFPEYQKKRRCKTNNNNTNSTYETTDKQRTATDDLSWNQPGLSLVEIMRVRFLLYFVKKKNKKKKQQKNKT